MEQNRLYQGYLWCICGTWAITYVWKQINDTKLSVGKRSSKCITHISSSRPKVMGWLKGRVLIPTGAQLFCYSEIPNSCLCLLNCCLIKQNSNSGFHCLGRVKCGFMFQPFWPTVPGWRTESLTLTLYESDQDARLIPNLTPGCQFQYPY